LPAGACRNDVPDRDTALSSEIYLPLNRYAVRELYIEHRMLEIVQSVLSLNLVSMFVKCHCTNFTVVLDI
jgi:hypothetical protein